MRNAGPIFVLAIIIGLIAFARTGKGKALLSKWLNQSFSGEYEKNLNSQDVAVLNADWFSQPIKISQIDQSGVGAGSNQDINNPLSPQDALNIAIANSAGS
ncbi:MAG: hypothetical protein WB424_16480 [Terracidiphilus sp.]